MTGAEPTARSRVPTSVRLLVAANVAFTAGLSVHAFLYNFYLEALGLDTITMGNAAAALTFGGLISLLPAGRATDSRSPRLALIAAGAVLTAGLAAGALVTGPVALIVAAAVAGAGGGIWRVGVGPALMRLTTPEQRPRAFAWNVGSLIAAGGVLMAGAGSLPQWTQSAFGFDRLASVRLALLLGAGISALSIVAFAMLPPAEAPIPDGSADAPAPAPRPERVAHDDGRRLYVVIAAIALWMLGPALAAPFLNIFLTRRFAFSLAEAGLAFAAAHLLWGGAVLLSGRLGERGGVMRLFTASIGAYAPIMVALAFTGSLPFALFLFGCQGLVGPLTNPLIDQLLLGPAPVARHGTLSAWRNAAADVSALAGASLGGVLLARSSFTGLFVISAAVGLGGGLLLIRAFRPRAEVSVSAS